MPEIEKEVNQGQNFALLRQVYYAAILAKWYRAEIQKTILAQVYIDKKKIAGINLKDNTIKEQIYQRYIRAYKKGVFNFIKDDTDNLTGQIIPRKYFSGGEILNQAMINERKVSQASVVKIGEDFAMSLKVVPEGSNAAMHADLINKSFEELTAAQQELVRNLAIKLSRLPQRLGAKVHPLSEYGDFINKKEDWKLVSPDFPDTWNVAKSISAENFFSHTRKNSLVSRKRGAITYAFVPLTETITTTRNETTGIFFKKKTQVPVTKNIEYYGLSIALRPALSLVHDAVGRSIVSVNVYFMSKQDQVVIQDIIHQFPEALFYCLTQPELIGEFKKPTSMDFRDTVGNYRLHYFDAMMKPFTQNEWSELHFGQNSNPSIPRYYYTPVNLLDTKAVEQFRQREAEDVVDSAMQASTNEYQASVVNNIEIRLGPVKQGVGILRLLEGHTGKIVALVFSTDGNFLGSGGEDKKIRIWNVRTGDCKRVISLSGVPTLYDVNKELSNFSEPKKDLPHSPSSDLSKPLSVEQFAKAVQNEAVKTRQRITVYFNDGSSSKVVFSHLNNNYFPTFLWPQDGESISLSDVKEIKIDSAQVSHQGGIDLNQISINRTGQGINLQFDAAQMSEITRPDFNGFRIIINSVTQIQNPLSLMGVHDLK